MRLDNFRRRDAARDSCHPTSRADNFGRKRACLFFTVAYTLSCITKMVDSLPSLAFGRLLGGLSTSLLFSVPEAYLVSEAKSHGMTQTALGELLGRCTLVNGVVASLAGVASDVVVNKSGTYKAPFVASGALLVVAGGIIACTWTENYGCKEGEGSCARSPWRTSFRALGQGEPFQTWAPERAHGFRADISCTQIQRSLYWEP